MRVQHNCERSQYSLFQPPHSPITDTTTNTDSPTTTTDHAPVRLITHITDKRQSRTDSPLTYRLTPT